jgi:hypothetical protein
MKFSPIRWELSCVTAELCAMAGGLWLLLGSRYSELGAATLFGVCVISFIFRLRHYSIQTA